MEQNYIDDIMDFNPENLSIFQETNNSINLDANIYKTNPIKFSKADDGHYRSIVRIIYNVWDVKKSIVPQVTYFLQDSQGSMLVRSKLANGNKNCEIFKSWKKLWFSGDPEKKEWAKKMYDKNESQWCLVQIIEDENQPELIGKILAWKLPKAIYNKMEAKMRPSPESKKTPVPIMDYLIGLPLEIDVAPGPDDPKSPERRQREISYDLCDFDSNYMPIRKIDGSQLFTDEELETIDGFVTAKNDLLKAKTEAKKVTAQKTIESLTPAIKELYIKAINYLKEHSLNLEEECGWKEWDEETTKRVHRWIDTVLKMKDPKAEDNLSEPVDSEVVKEGPDKKGDVVDIMMDITEKDDFPF